VSFTFSVATVSPPPLASIVDRLGGDLRFEEEEEVAGGAEAWPPMCVHLYTPGISTRGVELCHAGDAVKVRLLACSAPEDYELGLRLVRVLAELAGAPVRPDDAGELAAGELDGRYGAEWAAGQIASAAGALAALVRERGQVTMRGPVREFHVGRRLLAELDEQDGEKFPERLLDAFRRSQYVDPERYYEANPVEVAASDGRRTLEVVVWAPSSIGYLFSPVDYVFLMAREQDGGDMLVVPFDAVPEIAGDRCVFLDERQLLVEPVGEEEWSGLSERAESHRVELHR
jgi:hypothetical protein